MSTLVVLPNVGDHIIISCVRVCFICWLARLQGNKYSYFFLEISIFILCVI